MHDAKALQVEAVHPCPRLSVRCDTRHVAAPSDRADWRCSRVQAKAGGRGCARAAEANGYKKVGRAVGRPGLACDGQSGQTNKERKGVSLLVYDTHGFLFLGAGVVVRRGGCAWMAMQEWGAVGDVRGRGGYVGPGALYR